MNALHRNKPLLFAILWIVFYVVVTSITDNVHKGITFLFHLLLSIFLLFWLKREGLLAEYGICKPKFPPKAYLYYLPLVFLCSCNLWFGVQMNLPPFESLFYCGSMLCVGFLEELIFRGFLFKAMAKDGLRSAIIVSSLTFGIGHIVNLVNGSGMELVDNLCQIVSAVAFGLLFVVMFHRGKSLWPCIIAHSVINSLSTFAVEPESVIVNIAVSAALTVVALCYTVALEKTLPEENRT